MKILLLSPSNYQFIIPLGVGYIASYLEQENYKEIKLVSFYRINKTEIRKIIQQEEPDICGISCYTDNRASALELAKIIKEMDKNIFIVFGNIHATVMWKQLLTNYPYIDLIVLGEGEKVMLNVVTALDKNRDYSAIKGIAFRKNGNPVRTENEKFIDDGLVKSRHSHEACPHEGGEWESSLPLTL